MHLYSLLNQTGMADAIRRDTITAGETLVLTNPNRWMGDADWNARWENQYLGDLGRNHKLVALESDWVQAIHQQQLRADSDWPSTGHVAIAFALALAMDVGAPPPSVFGFGACAPCPKVPTSSTQLLIQSLHASSPYPPHSIPSHPASPPTPSRPVAPTY